MALPPKIWKIVMKRMSRQSKLLTDSEVDLAVCVDLNCPQFSQYKQNNVLCLNGLLLIYFLPTNYCK